MSNGATWFQLIRRLKKVGVAVTFMVASLIVPHLAEAQETPTVITPPEVTADPNGLNLMTGKVMTNRPSISVPAAPRLTYTRASDFMMYVDGQRNVGTKKGKWAVHYGGDRSESFSCEDSFCEPDNSDSGFGPQARGPSFFTQEKNGVGYTFNVLSYNYDNNVNTVNHDDNTVSITAINYTEYYASKVSYPDGEILSIQYDSYDTTPASGKRVVKVQSNTGYYLKLTYWDSIADGWLRVKTAAIYANADPSTPLAELDYSSDGTHVTDLAARVWACASDCGQYAFISPWASADTVALPGEAVPALSYANDPANPFVAQSITKDGVAWTYSYANVASQYINGALNSYKYDSVLVSGPNGYQRTYAIYNWDGGPYTGLKGRYRIYYVNSVTDELNRQTVFTYGDYHTSNRITGITYPEGNSSQFAYDIMGNIVTRTDKSKPGSGLPDLVQRADYLNGSGASCWSPNWYRDALNHQTDFAYNSRCQLTDRTDPADSAGVRQKTINEYQTVDTGAGLISRKTVTRTCGVGTTCGVSDETRVEYEYWGNTWLPSLERHIDPGTGAVRETHFTYDAAGRLLSTDGPLAGTADTQYFRYDIVGRKTWEIGALAPNGLRLAKRTHYRTADDKPDYVETGTLTSETDTNLQVFARVDVTYDSRRNPIREAQTGNGTTLGVTERSFLDRGLPECTAVRMNPANFGSPPTNACNLTPQGTQGPDRITHNVYDSAGQLRIVQKAYGITTANGFPTTLQQDYQSYDYTPNGKPAYVIDANGNKSAYGYDGFDRLNLWAFPSKTTPGAASTTDVEQYGYDANGNRTSLIKRDGREIDYGYDALNRMTAKTFVGGGACVAGYACTTPPSGAVRNVYYSYNLRGLQTYARFDSTSGADNVFNEYDGFGQLAASTINMAGTSRRTSYTYDADGNRISLKHPNGTRFVYNFDSLDRVTTGAIFNGAQFLSIAYDAQGRRQSTTRGASQTSYTYDPVSRLDTETQTFASGTKNTATTFGYNPANQITGQLRTNDAYAFTAYVPATKSYAVNGLNQYTTVDAGSLGYDSNGNLAATGGTSFTYDVENRLVSAVGTLSANLVYDPNGRLWQSSGGSYGTTQFLYDGDELIGEYDGTGNLLRRYVHGPGVDEPVMWIEGAALTDLRFYHPDHQGSIVATATAAGAPFETYTYDEYGVPGATNYVNKGRFQYTGQTWLPELGMYYYEARIYSAKLGRFLQTDPIGYKDQMDLYAYVGNDPIDGRDPSGTQSVMAPVYDGLDQATNSPKCHGDPKCGLKEWKEVQQGVAKIVAETAAWDLTGLALFKGVSLLWDAAKFGRAAGVAENVTSYSSFGALKRALGPAGPGKAWHHVVEQSQEARFGAAAIHNTENVVAIDAQVNSRLNALYSSRRPLITGSNSQTVRQWLSTQSYADAKSFGLRALDNVTRGIW